VTVATEAITKEGASALADGSTGLSDPQPIDATRLPESRIGVSAGKVKADSRTRRKILSWWIKDLS
jgi:hypothetical protein